MKLKLFFCSSCIIIITAILSSCKDKNRQNPQGGELNYQTMTIVLSDQVITDYYSASIKGKQDIDIYPQISGTIGKVCVTEGEHVQKGQKLFIIEQGIYYAALNQAMANVKSAEASLASSQLTYDSKVTLFNDSVISEYELQTARNNLDNSQANLAQAKAQEASARTNYEYTVITSPASGVVGNLPYFQGDLVNSSISQPLTTISDNSEMFVYFSITEKHLIALSREYGSIEKALKGMPDVSLQLSDGTEYGTKGRVESISGVVDRTTGSTTVRARFSNPDGLLHSGFSGNIMLQEVYQNCIVIPQAATTEIQDKKFVYKVVDGKAQSALVKVVSTDNGNEYVVTDGLSQGDIIISDGAGLIREGTAISISNDTEAK